MTGSSPPSRGRFTRLAVVALTAVGVVVAAPDRVDLRGPADPTIR